MCPRFRDFCHRHRLRVFLVMAVMVVIACATAVAVVASGEDASSVVVRYVNASNSTVADSYPVNPADPVPVPAPTNSSLGY